MIVPSLNILEAIGTNRSPRMNGVIANITEETTSKLEATSDISILFISVFLKQSLDVCAWRARISEANWGVGKRGRGYSTAPSSARALLSQQCPYRLDQERAFFVRKRYLTSV